MHGSWRPCILALRCGSVLEICFCLYCQAHALYFRIDNELWVMALEKGYAKMSGTYDRLVGGLVHVALVGMTGGFGEEMYIATYSFCYHFHSYDMLTLCAISRLDAKVKRNVDALWERLLQYSTAGYLMGAGSNPGSDAEPDEKGIVPVR